MQNKDIFLCAGELGQILGYSSKSRGVAKAHRNGTIPPPSHNAGTHHRWLKSVIDGYLVGDVYKDQHGVWVWRDTGNPVPVLAKFEVGSGDTKPPAPNKSEDAA